MLPLACFLCLGVSPLQNGHGNTQTPVDKSIWIAQEVRLYYFPNPMVLAQTLNPSGKMVTETTSGSGGGGTGGGVGTGTLSTTDSLPEALGKHINALNAIERLKQAVKTAERRLADTTRAERDAERKKAAADRAVDLADDKVEDAQAKKHEASDAVGKAKEELAKHEPPTTPETPAAKAERERQRRMWTARVRTLEATERAAERRVKDLEYEKTLKVLDQGNAQEDLTAATSAKTAAATALSEAQTDADGAADKVATEAENLRKARYKAQAEAANRLQGIQTQREKLNFWYAAGDPEALDPVAKVDISVYPDSKTVFLRGKPEDVRQVREIIAQFDKPSPQARVTLWTLELNLIGNKGRNALSNKATAIEKHMENAREQMAKVGRYFRESIEQEVSLLQGSKEVMMTQSQPNPVPLKDRLDGQRLARSFWYEPEVARQLGLHQDKILQVPEYYYYTRWTLPDPAAITTTGEAVLVYVLARKSERNEVDRIFAKKLRDDTALSGWTPRRFMNELGMGNVASGANMNAYQLEITRALKRSALDRFIEKSPDIVGLYSEFRRYFKTITTTYVDTVHGSMTLDQRQGDWVQHMLLPTRQRKLDPQKGVVVFDNTHPDWKKLVGTKDELRAGGIGETTAFLAPALLWLREEFGISIQVYEDLAKNFLRGAQTDQDALDEFAFQTINALRRAYPTDQSNARIAAADEMLKRIMIALEDDLQEQFVVPALEDLKKDLNSRAISVGKIDRTSIIATNRLAASVEGTASAELDLGGQERLIDAALSLTELLTAAKGAKLPDALRKLQGFDQEPTSEFYAIASGSQFKITPIFDPSGQALNFQFDHVKNTNVLDSDGTNPSLPRVDNHTTSMRVQVSNMEIRELTRFETNTKLGVPEKRWGGIPFLNGLYPLSEIPIIGWFSRKSGRDAVSQTSVLFAQNAMYPTIGDLGNLLSSGFGVPPLNAQVADPGN